MRKDPIVEEVRKYRQARAARFGFDAELIARDVRRRERAGKRKPVSPKPRKLVEY